MPDIKRPYANTGLAKYIDYKIESIKETKTEQDIANEMGFLEAKDIRRIRNGEEAVPLDWIGRLAHIINAVPANLYRMAIDQHWPDLQPKFAETFGAIASPNETHLFLRKWREVTENRDPVVTPEIRQKINRMFEEVKVLLAAR